MNDANEGQSRHRHALIIGAQKAGTTYLHNLLVRNSGFCGAFVKEPHYFTSSRKYQSTYGDIFPPAPDGKTLLDSSVSYLHNPACVEEIASRLGSDTPVMAMIRNPLDRIVSAYLHNVKHGREIRSLQEVLTLDSFNYEDLLAEETERMSVAARRGKIAFRKPSSAPSITGDQHFGDDCYDDPTWNFRYVANTMYWEQLEPFRRTFSWVIVVPFSVLTSDPQYATAQIAHATGHEIAPEFSDSRERNRTRIARRTVLKKYFRNATSGDHAAERLLNTTRGLYNATFRLPLDLTVPDTVKSRGWFQAVEQSYRQANEAAFISGKPASSTPAVHPGPSAPVSATTS